MRKLSTLVLLAMLVSPAFFASSATSSVAIPVEPELVTVCYYGVTLTVSPKIATRMPRWLFLQWRGMCLPTLKNNSSQEGHSIRPAARCHRQYIAEPGQRDIDRQRVL